MINNTTGQTSYLRRQPSRLNFYIIGNNISHSLSPKIHNSSFAELGLPHYYSIYQTPKIDDGVRAIIRNPDFGGASVTFPHKLAIGELLDGQSEAAKLIGAVNTVVVHEGTLYGDNTDWLGIMNVLRGKKLITVDSGLVIGAGGAARAAVFALQHMGARKITIVNRTEAAARKLASYFPSLCIECCTHITEASPASIIIGCIPADDINESDIPEHIFADSGVVVEMSYRPPVSALMRAAAKHDNWQVVDGVGVLKEQAYAQFQLWTGREAPRHVIERVLGNR